MSADVLTVRDVARAALLGGSFGYLRIPAGATVQVRHMARGDKYRVTFDVTAGWMLEPEQAASFNADTLRWLAVPTDRAQDTAPRTHELKCWPPFFQAILDGDKNFEVRKNDRGFQAGDTLRLREWDPDRSYGSGGYTGRDLPMSVAYVLSGFDGIAEGYVVMGLRDA